MTEALFLETAHTDEELKEQGERRLNVAGVLRKLGVSRSGYNNWKNRLPSKRELRKNALKEKILDIYNESHQNYGAPKIMLFVTLSTPHYEKIIHIKKRYSINYSDALFIRLFYPVPSVIIVKSLIKKEAGTAPTKVWFPASNTNIG